MRTKVGIALASLMAGLLLASLVPASAHHSTSFDRLKKQVSALKNQVGTLKNQVKTLQSQAQLLDTDGFYNGPVIGSQVIGLCEPATQAVWEQNSFDPTLDIQWIDDCISEQQQAAARRQAARTLNK